MVDEKMVEQQHIVEKQQMMEQEQIVEKPQLVGEQMVKQEHSGEAADGGGAVMQFMSKNHNYHISVCR